VGIQIAPRAVRQVARTIRLHRAGILTAIRLGLSNGRLEGLNHRIRLISHRSFAFHSAAPHRPRLPLLQPDRHRLPSMTFTPNSTGAPHFCSDASQTPTCPRSSHNEENARDQMSRQRLSIG
jgi:hypothetical protein